MISSNDVKTKIVGIIVEIYNERIISTTMGNDTLQNETEMEVLYNLYTNIKNLQSTHEKVSDSIFSTWVMIRLHHILIDMRSEFLDDSNIVTTYDKLANEILLRSFID